MTGPVSIDRVALYGLRERAKGYAECYFDEHGSQYIFDDVNNGVLSIRDLAADFAAHVVANREKVGGGTSLKAEWRQFENGLRAIKDGQDF